MEKAYMVIYDGTIWNPKPVVIVERSPIEYKIKYKINYKVKRIRVPVKQIFLTKEEAERFAEQLNGEEEWTGLRAYL